MVIRNAFASPARLAAFSMQCALPVFGRRSAFGSPSIRSNPPAVYANLGVVLFLVLNFGGPALRPLRSPFRPVRQAFRQRFQPVTVGFLGVLSLPWLTVPADGQSVFVHVPLLAQRIERLIYSLPCIKRGLHASKRRVICVTSAASMRREQFFPAQEAGRARPSPLPATAPRPPLFFLFSKR